MINTDRYDPELWRDAEDNLIADAPLLLAEVLRLRGLLDAANERARVAIESHPNADEMLKEMIE